MRSRKSRFMSLLLAGVTTVGLLAGCSNSENGGGGGTDSGGSRDSINIATMSETPSRCIQRDHNATAGSYMNLLTYSTLFNTDMEMQAQRRTWWIHMKMSAILFGTSH